MFLVLSHFLCPVSRSGPFVKYLFICKGARGDRSCIHFFVVLTLERVAFCFCFSAVGLGDTSYHMQHFCYEVKTKPT